MSKQHENERVARLYRRKLVIKMFLLQRAAQMTDLKIVSGEYCFHVHKVILAAGNNFFYNLFTKHLNDSQRLALHDIIPESVNSLLEYVYTGCTFEINKYFTRWKEYFDMEEICEYRKKLMLKSLSSNCFLYLWDLAKIHALKEMTETVANFVAENIIECMDCQDFLKLSLQQISSVLVRITLEDDNDPLKIHTICNWISYDTKLRNKYLTNLLLSCHLSSSLRRNIAPILEKLLVVKVDDGKFVANDELEDAIVQVRKQEIPEDLMAVTETDDVTSIEKLSDEYCRSSSTDLRSNSSTDETVSLSTYELNFASWSSTDLRQNDYLIPKNSKNALIPKLQIPPSDSKSENSDEEDSGPILIASGFSPRFFDQMKKKYKN